MKIKWLSVVVAAFAVSLVASVPANAAQHLYLANGDDGATTGQALAFSIGPNGKPADLQTLDVPDSDYFNGASMTPDGKYVFMAAYYTDSIYVFSVGADGKLTQAPGSPKTITDSGPYGTAVTPDGKFLLYGAYDENAVEALAIGANGSLSQVPGGFLDLTGVSPYDIAVSTDGGTVYVPSPGTDEVYAASIAANGALTELTGSPYPAGNDPYHAGVTPDGRFLYVPNYNGLDISGYSIAADGSLTELPGSPFAVASAFPYGGFAISPDGTALYTSGSDIIQPAVIGADGSLTAGTDVPVGAYNPALTMSPDGSRLYNATGDNTPDQDELTTYLVGTGGALTADGLPLQLPTTSNLDTQSLVHTPAQPPVAALTAEVTGSGAETNVSFDASGSTDPDGSAIVSYTWDFGDGTTAATMTPTTTHSYDPAGGPYNATVTLIDADGCSTDIVFTGQTAYCNGSDVATAATEVDTGIAGTKVKAKKTQKQKGKKLVIKVKAGADEAVSLEAKGTAKFKGLKGKVALKKKKASAAAGKTKTLKLGAKSKKKGKAAVGKKGKAKITVTLTDDAGNVVKEKVSVKLK
jgi:6-phosphogluconolactonase